MSNRSAAGREAGGRWVCWSSPRPGVPALHPPLPTLPSPGSRPGQPPAPRGARASPGSAQFGFPRHPAVPAEGLIGRSSAPALLCAVQPRSHHPAEPATQELGLSGVLCSGPRLRNRHEQATTRGATRFAAAVRRAKRPRSCAGSSSAGSALPARGKEMARGSWRSPSTSVGQLEILAFRPW